MRSATSPDKHFRTMPSGLVDEGPMSCRLCGSVELRPYYSQGNDRQYRFYKCSQCRLVNYDLRSGLDQGKYADEIIDPLDHRNPLNQGQTDTFEYLRRHLPAKGTFLDIGCGNGRLLYLARECGWEVRGMELSPILAERVRESLGIDVDVSNFLESDLGEVRFDLVSLRHVLEHLPDSKLAMSKIRALVKPGGRAVLEFPNIDALGLRWKRFLDEKGVRRKRYRVDYVPGHCNEFCRDSFAYLAEETGFVLESWSTYSANPVANALYKVFPLGNKARVLVRRK